MSGWVEAGVVYMGVVYMGGTYKTMCNTNTCTLHKCYTTTSAIPDCSSCVGYTMMHIRSTMSLFE